MSKFKEFATSVRKIATSEVVLAQLEILEKEHDQIRERLKEAEYLLYSIQEDIYVAHDMNNKIVNPEWKTMNDIKEYKTKYGKE